MKKYLFVSILFFIITLIGACSKDEVTANTDTNQNTNTTPQLSEIQISLADESNELSFDWGFPNHDVVKRSFSISNKGNKSLTISSIDLPEGYSFTNSFSQTKLNPSASLDISIRFSPTEVKEYKGTLKVNSDANSGINTLSLVGRGATTVEDYDGNVYDIVKIGNRLWITENFRGTHYANGDGVGRYYKLTDPEADKVHGYYYEKETSAGWSFGASRPNSYDFMDGFTVPSIYDWNNLFNKLGGKEIAGGRLKQTGTNNWRSPNTGATNRWGFNAVPSGTISALGNIAGFGFESTYWSYDPEGTRIHGRYYNEVGFEYDSREAFIRDDSQNYVGYYPIRLVR